MLSRRGSSLALLSAVYTAAVIAGGMGIYAVYQYVTAETTNATTLLLEHGVHVLGLGVAVYLALGAVLYRKVVRPLEELDLKLYAISRGDFSPITIETNVNEIRQIAEVVNFVLAELRASEDRLEVAGLAEGGRRLRGMAHQGKSPGDEARRSLISITNEIDEVTEKLSVADLRRNANGPAAQAPA